MQSGAGTPVPSSFTVSVDAAGGGLFINGPPVSSHDGPRNSDLQPMPSSGRERTYVHKKPLISINRWRFS